jgi:glucosamine-6-phosphate deaminase
MQTTMRVDQMEVSIFESNDALGAAAATDLSAILEIEIAARGAAAILLATGNSQLTFLRALRSRDDVAWARVRVFHMDEYLDMHERHPASFRRYLHDQLVDIVRPAAFHGIAGDAPDVGEELRRYARLLAEHPPVGCVLGIGENGHLAFNDPPSDFSTREVIHVVALDAACRRQQVNEGHFSTLDSVPTHAISLTVPALLRSRHVLAVVPEARKAPAVKAALTGPVSPWCPASILRTAPNVKLYLDRDSARSLLTPTAHD